MWTTSPTENGQIKFQQRGVAWVTWSRDPYTIWHTLKHISKTSKAMETWNLARGCIWTISPKWRNNISENGPSLSHVTLIKFVTPSNISPKWVTLQTLSLSYGCKWTFSPKQTNKNPVKGRGLGHVTCYKISHSDIGLSPKRVSATVMKFSIRMHMDNFSKTDK